MYIVVYILRLCVLPYIPDPPKLLPLGKDRNKTPKTCGLTLHMVHLEPELSPSVAPQQVSLRFSLRSAEEVRVQLY
eukprot:COSAG01_NODE_14516_length_1444_cov_42.245353_3_plen_75_part_01